MVEMKHHSQPLLTARLLGLLTGPLMCIHHRLLPAFQLRSLQGTKTQTVSVTELHSLLCWR